MAAKTYVWRDARGYIAPIAILLALCAVNRVVGLGVMVAFGEAAVYSAADLDFNSAQMLTWIVDVSGLIFLPSSVLFLLWTRAVSRNAHAVDPYMQYSVRSAIGWYFVPLANLLVPGLAMREIWDVSTPDHTRGSRLIGVWWGFWVASVLIAILALAMGGPLLRLLSPMVQIPSLFFSALLVKRLTLLQAQAQGAGRYGEGSLSMAPAPRPAFADA